ncbi:flagellar basal body-associated FliL family protein [Maridesulfovibrio sp.]|uniref:flagellar basal body-associated FliL family protein n=1 Tax=Maridesulfovibrio sp. TaxID=2795000 RepID=UPI0039EFBA26
MKIIKSIILIALVLSCILLANTAGATTIDEVISFTTRKQFLALVLVTAAESQTIPVILNDNEIGISTGKEFQHITYSPVTKTISITSDWPDPSNYVETFLVELKDGRRLKLSTVYEFEDNQILNMEVNANRRRNRIQSFLMEQTAGSVDSESGRMKLKSQIRWIANDVAFRNPVTGVEAVELVVQ